MRRVNGFSILEMTIAMGMLLSVTAGVFAVLSPAQASFQVNPEVSDMHQRLRVASNAFYKDLLMAGAGVYLGTQAGSLAYFFAPIMPSRQGAVGDDPPGTFRTDTITILYVPSTTAQTTLAAPVSGAGALPLSVNNETDCPIGQTLCGFSNGESVLLFNADGEYDVATVSGVTDAPTATIAINRSGNMGSYATGDKITEVVDRTYYLKTDNAAQVYQVMSYDGTTNADVPLVDHVVGLSFRYYGDPQPPQLTGKPLTDLTGPWTTYGPKPPPLGAQIPSRGYPAGENCVFMLSGGAQVPRMPVLGAGGTSPVELLPSQLDGSDGGPWCPDATNANRWDADLLRIRRVAVTLRVQAGLAALRGPAGVLFAHGGSSRDATRWAPDQEVTFQVTPRNLNFGR